MASVSCISSFTPGAVFEACTGMIRVKFGYLPLFIIAGSAYLVALLYIHLLVPGLEPVDMNELNQG